MGVFSISPEMIQASQEFSSDPFEPDGKPTIACQSSDSLNQPIQPCPIWFFESLPNGLVESLPGPAAFDAPLLPMPPHSLKTTDEMKVAELMDPTFLFGQSLGSSEIVGNPPQNTILDIGRNSPYGFFPMSEVLPSLEKDGIEKDGPVFLAGFDGCKIQSPQAATEMKPETIAQKNQFSRRKDLRRGARDKSLERLTESVAKGLDCNFEPAGADFFEVLALLNNPLDQALRVALAVSPALFGTNSPCAPAGAALAAFATKAIDSGTTTFGFPMYCFHTWEISNYQKKVLDGKSLNLIPCFQPSFFV